MADSTSQPPQAAAKQRTYSRSHRPQRLLPYTAVVLLTLMILVGISVLIALLEIRPKRLVFTVEYQDSVHNFYITDDRYLSATFDFSIISYNPNHRVSFFYDFIDVRWVNLYDDQDIIASSAVNPFFQPRQNATRLNVKLTAQNVSSLRLNGMTSPEYPWLDKAVNLNVLLDTRLRFKVGSWKSRTRILRIWCFPVFDLMMHLSSSNNTEVKNCDVEL